MSSTATVPHSVPEPHSRPLSVLAFAWIVTLAVSFMPDILITELRIDWPIPLLWTKVIALAFFFGITFVWAEVRALRFYFILFATLTLATGLTTWVAGTEFWRGTFSGSGFTARMLPEQLLRLIVALIVLAALFAIYRRGERFFFRVGNLSAPARPVPLLGIDASVRWSRLGWISALCIALGVGAFVFLFGNVSLGALGSVIPLLPAVLLFAAMNAFNEELPMRAALLAPLRDAVGAHQAVLMTAALFGLWHFYGVPYGVLGVAMSAALGWFIGKCMVETDGLFWPWFIHFVQDIVIFSAIAIGSITPGG